MAGPAATVGSNHICPMCSGTVPHVGGPITQGEPTVLIGGKPAATVGSMSAHGGSVVIGEGTVLIGTGSSSPTAVMPIKKIPFPKISFTNKVLGNAKKAIEKQEALRQESENTEGEPKVYNHQWRKAETVIRDRKVLKIVTLTADVMNIPDGQTATIKVIKPSSNENEEEQVIELTGTVKDKRITVEWELEDASLNENTNS